MGVDEIIKLVTSVGFPVVVASYLLFRMEREMRSLTAGISGLITVVSNMNEKLEKLYERRNP